MVGARVAKDPRSTVGDRAAGSPHGDDGHRAKIVGNLVLLALVGGVPLLWVAVPRTAVAFSVAAAPVFLLALAAATAGGVVIAAWRWRIRGSLAIAAGPAYLLLLPDILLTYSGVGT